MKRITVGDPMLVAQVEAAAEREHRQPSDALRLLLQLGLREAKRAGGVTLAVWAGESHEPRSDAPVENLLPFHPR